MSEKVLPYDEILLGGSATDKVGFYGKAPVVQGAAVTDLATDANGTAIAADVNAIIARLEAVGIIAS